MKFCFAVEPTLEGSVR